MKCSQSIILVGASASMGRGNRLRNACSQALSQTYWKRNSKGGAQQSVLRSPPDDSEACFSLENLCSRNYTQNLTNDWRRQENTTTEKRKNWSMEGQGIYFHVSEVRHTPGKSMANYVWYIVFDEEQERGEKSELKIQTIAEVRRWIKSPGEKVYKNTLI